MKCNRLLRALPAMCMLFWRDSREYATRLYVRASWKALGLSLAPSALLHYEHRGQIQVQGPCSVGYYSVIMTCAPKNEKSLTPLLVIGDNVYFGDQVNIRAAGGVIRIGRDVLIANMVTVVASNHGTALGKPMIAQDWTRGDVLIEDDVWIGAGVVVLPGSTIRKGAVIGAGAVVRGEIPPNTVYGGIPARQIGLRS